MASSSSSLSIGGLASGLDTNAIIDGLVGIERTTIAKLENKKTKVDLSISAWGQLQSNLMSLSSKGETLSKSENFDKFKLASSNEDILTLEGRDGGMPGDFSIRVFQTARSEKILSNTFASGNTALGLSGEFSINLLADYKKSTTGATDPVITITAGDALKDIVNKINAAPNGGVSASMIKLGDNQYSMVLTSKDSGAAGATYQETTGTVLQSLGILDAAGGKGITAQKLQTTANTAGGSAVTAATLLSAIDGSTITANDTITLSGTDRNGNKLAERNVVISDPATMTVGDLLKEIESSFNGMVTAAIENGRITVTDKTGGKSSLAVDITANNEGGGALSFGGKLAIQTAGKSTILQTGQNAFFSVDGLYMSSAQNDADDAIQGVTIKMKKADLTETVNASIDRDKEAILGNVQEFIDIFNLTLKTIDESSKVTVKVSEQNTDNSKDKDTLQKGPLAGDSTVGRLKSGLISVFNRQREEMMGTPYTSLASIGITSSHTTGEYTINAEKFNKAVDTDYESVRKLFILSGTSDNSEFLYGTSTKDTASGRYRIDVTASRVEKLDRNNLVTASWAATLESGILTVSEKGSAQGLSITVPASGSSLFTFSKGLGRELADFAKISTDAYSGFITQRKKNLESTIKEYDTQIASQEDRVARYEEKLKLQFAALEQTMSRLKAQGNQMSAQLG